MFSGNIGNNSGNSNGYLREYTVIFIHDKLYKTKITALLSKVSGYFIAE
jgi:hypothetical protein